MKIVLLITFIQIILSFQQVYADNKSCGGKKILICHKEGKSHLNGVELCVDISSLDGHLLNHEKDRIGPCDQFDLSLVEAYVCNAGLKYKINPDKYCIRHDEGNLISDSCGPSKSCTCSEIPHTEDANFQNAIRYSSSPYSSDVNQLDYIERIRFASKTNDYEQISTELGTQILKGNSALQFNLGATRYGAEYFVDICILNQNENTSLVPMIVTGAISSFGSGVALQRYPQSSKLSHKLEIYCDRNNKGAFSLESYPFFTQSEIPFHFDQRNFTAELVGSRFCIVRNYLKENQNYSLRGNLLQKVTFQTLLNIEGANTNEDQRHNPINLCKIEKIEKNNFRCTPIKFSDSENFKDFLLLNYGSENSKKFSDDFENVYNSACPSPCSAF